MILNENLAPENYPLSWLIGCWRGGGLLEYENVPASAYLHQLTIEAETDAPYIRLHSAIWLANEPATAVDKEHSGLSTWETLSKAERWSELTGFIRVNPEAERREDGASAIEAMMAAPSGTSQIWVGLIRGPQIQMVTDLVARAAAGAELTSAQLLAGLVNSDLMYTYDMEAFGFPMRSYLAGRLSRA